MAEGGNEGMGEGTGKLGPWSNEDEPHRANKQQGDPDALAVDGEPRGGVQSDEYRLAEPREIVVEGDVAMSGPGGAPQDGMSIEERRKLGDKMRSDRARHVPDPGL